jgi:helicase MOV-10
MTRLCPDFAKHGTCKKQSCSYKHQVSLCEQCGLRLSSPEDLAAHLRSKRHKKRITASGSEMVQCPTCKKNVSFHEWASHLSTGAHQRSLNPDNNAATVVQPGAPIVASNQIFCSACKIVVQQTGWDKHARSTPHREKERIAAYREVLDRDKNGIKVSKNGDFGVIDVQKASAGQSAVLLIENTVSGSRINIVDAKLGMSNKGSSTG